MGGVTGSVSLYQLIKNSERHGSRGKAHNAQLVFGLLDWIVEYFRKGHIPAGTTQGKALMIGQACGVFRRESVEDLL